MHHQSRVPAPVLPLCIPAPSVGQDSLLGFEHPNEGGCYTSSAKGSAAAACSSGHGSLVSAQCPHPRGLPVPSQAIGWGDLTDGAEQPLPTQGCSLHSQHNGDPRSPPLPGDRGTPRLYSFSCKTHTCSSSVQVCILKITAVWRQKESLFHDWKLKILLPDHCKIDF